MRDELRADRLRAKHVNVPLAPFSSVRGTPQRLDQCLALAFAQLTYRESLRDIESCLRSVQPRLYHNGLPLCLWLFPWAPHQRSKAGVKVHTLPDLRGSIPSYLHISGAHTSDVSVLDRLPLEAGSIYVMDRGYIHFKRLYALAQAAVFFVVRARDNMQYRRRYSHPVDKATGLRSDQTIVLTGVDSAYDHPAPARRVHFFDAEHRNDLVFITNHFSLPALTIAQLYKRRWKVELFFKWIKQHLRIQAFYGTSPNAVKTQIWIATSVYLLLAIR